MVTKLEAKVYHLKAALEQVAECRQAIDNSEPIDRFMVNELDGIRPYTNKFNAHEYFEDWFLAATTSDTAIGGRLDMLDEIEDEIVAVLAEVLEV